MLAVSALLIAGVVYLFVPPPPPAAAFEAQSSWGGTGGGTANAQTIAIRNVQSLNDVLGVPLRYVPALDNTGPATIAIGSMAATAVRRPSNIGLVALSGGELQAGVTMTVMFNGSTIEIQGPVDMTPIGRTVEFRQSATPRGTLIEDGSCVSRATYAPLFSLIGTNYGSCDGTTTFGLPNSNGTMFAALDNQGANGSAGRITSAGSGCNATAVGLCGSEKHTMLLTELVAHTHANTLTDPGHAHSYLSGTSAAAGGSGGTYYSPNGAFPVASGTAFTGMTINNANAGGGNPMPILNPVLLGRRAIKF